MAASVATAFAAAAHRELASKSQFNDCDDTIGVGVSDRGAHRGRARSEGGALGAHARGAGTMPDMHVLR